MRDDWEEVKARLEQRVSGGDPLAAKSLLAADIRAALQRVELYAEQEGAIRSEFGWERDGRPLIECLRQRVEELEASDRESLEMYRRCRERAEAAEAKLAKVVAILRRGVPDQINGAVIEQALAAAKGGE